MHDGPEITVLQPPKFRAQAATNRVASQWQRQPSYFLPPLAEIHDAMQSRFVVGQLAFVNNEAGLLSAIQHLRDDLVERDDIGFDSGS